MCVVCGVVFVLCLCDVFVCLCLLASWLVFAVVSGFVFVFVFVLLCYRCVVMYLCGCVFV